MRLPGWLRQKPYPKPDERRLQVAVDDLCAAIYVATGTRFRYVVADGMFGSLTAARIVLETWMGATHLRDELDAELFALEATIAEEALPR